MTTVITQEWTHCPACGEKVSEDGNPIFCLKCGTDIVRMTGQKP